MKNLTIGCLWVKKSKEGKTYMSGVIERDMVAAMFMRAIKEEKDLRIVCFRDEEKKNEKMPDFRIILSEPQEQKVAVNDNFDDNLLGNERPVKFTPINDGDIPVIEETKPDFGTEEPEISLKDIPF